MQKEVILDKISQAIFDSDEEAAVEYINLGLAAEIEPAVMIQQGLKRGMDRIGEEFSCHNMFLPELISGAETFKVGVALLNPHIEAMGSDNNKAGLILLGTVKGDIHDLGKNIIGLMYSVSGFDVVDLGVDVDDAVIVGKVRELKPDILGLSSMLTNTREKQRDIIELMEREGLRDQTKVIIGGAVVNQEWADSIGADAIGLDAAEAITKARALLNIE